MKICAIDCETEAFSPEGKIRRDAPPPPMVALCWAVNKRGQRDLDPFVYPDYGAWNDVLHVDGTAAKAMWDEYLVDADIFVFHNSGFDIAVLESEGFEPPGGWRKAIFDGRVRDTFPMYKLRYPLRDKANTLEAIAHHVCGIRLQKDAVRNSFRRDRELTPKQHEYARKDAAATLAVYERLTQITFGELARLPEEEIIACRGAYNAGDPDLMYSQAAALLAWYPLPLALDRTALAEELASARAELGEVTTELLQLGMVRCASVPGPSTDAGAAPPNGRRTWKFCRVEEDGPVMDRVVRGRYQERPGRWAINEAAVRTHYEAAAAELGIKPPLSEKTGKISTDQKFWRQHKLDLPHALQVHLHYQKVKKTLSSFLEPLEHVGGVIRPKYFLPGAETGRWSCSRPNTQQLPKNLRRLYTYPGKVIVAADYSCLELFTLCNTMAAMGIRGKLLELLEDGRDIHQLVADMIGCTRQEAKVCNYGCPGGLGRKKFGLYMRGFGVDVTDDEAATLREKWFKLFPDIRQWMDLHEVDPWKFKPDHLEPAEWLRELGFDPENETWPSRFKLLRTLHDGAIYTVMLPSGRIVPQRRYSAALNFQFQGPGADIITCAFIKVVEAGLEPFAVVHDSINIVTQRDYAHERGEVLAREMQAAQKLCCPLAPAPLPKYEVSEHML